MSVEKESIVQPELAPDAIVEDVQAPDSKPPDGGYGWVCVIASFMINGMLVLEQGFASENADRTQVLHGAYALATECTLTTTSHIRYFPERRT